MSIDAASNPKPSRPPGFAEGFAALFRAVADIARAPRSWPYALVPALILSGLSVAFAALALYWVGPLVKGWFSDPETWYAEASRWLAALLSAALGVLVALALTPPLSAPALERIVALIERQLGVAPRTPLGFFSEMVCGLRAQFWAFLVAGPILAALWLVDLFVAPAAVVTMPLKAVVASLALAWNLFDYPLTLRGVSVRARLALLVRNKRAVAGFGAAFAILFWVPCFGVLLLPVGVAAATRLLWRILRARPELLPDLPRSSLSSGRSRCRAGGAAESSARSC